MLTGVVYLHGCCVPAVDPTTTCLQIARQQSGEKPNKRSQRSIEKATATLERLGTEDGMPLPEDLVNMASNVMPMASLEPAAYPHHLDALAYAAAEVDAGDVPIPGTKPKKARSNGRPLYEQDAEAGLPPRAVVARTVTHVSAESAPLIAPPVSEVQELAASLGVPPAFGMPWKQRDIRCVVVTDRCQQKHCWQSWHRFHQRAPGCSTSPT